MFTVRRYGRDLPKHHVTSVRLRSVVKRHPFEDYLSNPDIATTMTISGESSPENVIVELGPVRSAARVHCRRAVLFMLAFNWVHSFYL